MDKISIIVPVYNAEKYLRKCLDSISNQTYGNLQIILVDDGSIDSSGDICEEYVAKDSRFEVHHQKNSGQATARNVGLAFADGDWIGFADDDDVLESNMYEILLTNAHNYDVLISGCATNTVYEDGNMFNTFSDVTSGIKDGDDLNLDILYQTSHAWGAMWNKIFHKSLIDKLKYPDGYQLEDYWVAIRLYHEIGKIYFDNRPLYNWYYRSISQSHKKMCDNKLTIFEMSEKIKKYCIKSSKLKKGGYYFSFINHVSLIWQIVRYDKVNNYGTILKEKIHITYNNLFRVNWFDHNINKRIMMRHFIMLIISSIKLFFEA